MRRKKIIIKKPESKNENEISINQDKTMDDDFYNDLKKWRFEKAKEEKIPPYCIFHNKTLNEIAEKMPENFIELLKINGIGQVNIERYGKEIIDLVKINMEKSSIETEGKKRIRI